MTVQILGRQASSEGREMSQIAQDQIQYMENILTDMLAYARPEAVRTEWVSIDKLLDATLSGLQKRIGDAGTELAVSYQPGLPTLPADANKLRQLFSNLIVNALQSVEQQLAGGRRVAVYAKLFLGRQGTAIQVEICDNGAGVDAGELERLFEPFYTTRARGTGLGLAIVRQIARQHGGEVVLLPRSGGGVCARVRLPTTPVDVQMPAIEA